MPATRTRTPAKKRTARKSTARKSTARKSAAKTPTVRKASTARKASARKTAARYTRPALRDRLKARILKGSRGGKPGQWSARKAQLLAHEYEAAGGGYGGRRTAAQRHLAEWKDPKSRPSRPKRQGTARGTTSKRARKTASR
ncbi:hypothetical protein [Roseisolibacter sp. H3M3-2]|uniref:hypothetical protein n=1 Tax=Roseisolibacter sp. H3M3-2 TaxID=3031323 RepID=UPI0023DCDED6|nr:hypothetical protein [Roseisolibacter sp. H3M3-2]MDF1504547.1 hypothetical protein [Roseisolibacter sp. H3M3-2]